MVGTDIAIDLGTANFRLYMDGRGLLIHAPNVIAVDTESQQIVAVGQDALEMMGRTGDRIRVVKPLANGVISDFSLTDATIRHYLKQVSNSRVLMPRVVVTVPCGITEVEKRAVVDAIAANGVRKICLLEAPVAAAMGADMDIARPHGTMVISIGEGITSVGVVSMNGLSSFGAAPVAGAAFNEGIRKYARKNFDLLIGDRMAEAAKRAVGCAYPMREIKTFELKGRSLRTGLPAKVTVNSDQIGEAMLEPLTQLVKLVQNTMESTPPELMADVCSEGVYLAGGSAALPGLDTLLSKTLQIRVQVLEEADTAVIRGAGSAVRMIDRAKVDPKSGNRTTPLIAYY